MEGGVVDLVQELPFEEVRRQAHLKRAMATTAGKRRKDKKAMEIDAMEISAEEIHAEVERKKAERARRARERKEKQQCVVFWAEKKLRLVRALQAKLDAQRGKKKKKKLPVMPLPAGELKRKEAVKQKTMTEMFLFTGGNLLAHSDPISSSSGSRPEGLAFVVASSAPQQEIVTVSSDTMLPSDNGSGFTDFGQVEVLGLSCESVDQRKRKASNVVHLSSESEGHDSDLPEDLNLSNL